MKVCSKCKLEKPKAEFSKESRSKCGLRSCCKACERAYKAENAEAISARQRVYRAENSEAIMAKWREYYVKNAESIAAKQRKYHVDNKETISARMREYYVESKESITAQKREYNAANPEKLAAHSRNRRARVSSAEGSHTAADVKTIFESQRGRCASCPKKLVKSGKNKYHVDHIKPLAKGGSNDKYNLQCLCPTCNLRKKDKDPFGWAKEIGKLL